MALSVFRRPLADTFDTTLSLPSSWYLPDTTPFARDIAAVANTQVDWRETPSSHIFKANLPGLSREDVKVQVEDGRILQISGERGKEESYDSDRWHRVERSRGSFVRRFRLPDNARLDEVKASLENGVLSVIVPKFAPAEPRFAIRDVDITD
ncbi:hypothetical protein KP509_17G067700 [Ceratopteris richardii]|uniref:SHSP domain-containing protein n=1 Tax=Ceratopteris richardii TaxID=49495 RepID=A0A8T2SZ41_CERRI|nr:hypothetical protein KP509_17G067700 [Ceratopteris richardii]